MKPGFRARFTGLFAAFAIGLAVSLAAPATAQAKYASFVVDADSGRILHAVNPDTRNYPASLTKMMTLYLAFEAIEDGTLMMGQRMKVSRRASRQPASKLGLKPGSTITVRHAILSLITKSANDVASVFADTLGGGERKFALIMTAKARKLGMSRTIFRNSSGLPHSAQMSTARDMATLAKSLMSDFPKYYHYFSTPSFVYKGKRMKNHNKLLTSYKGVDGIKTGYIRASGFNLVASAKRGETRLIGVVLGGRSPKARNAHMTTLLNKGFRIIDGGPATLPIAKAKPKKKKAVRVASSKKKRSTKKRTAKRTTKKSTTASRAKSRGKSRWGVQVGVYKHYKPAYNIARKAVSKAPGLLAKAEIQVSPFKRKRGGTYFRARLLGIAKKDAYRACRILKKRKLGCMELRIKGSVQVASTAN